jgi:hypothetical protein
MDGDRVEGEVRRGDRGKRRRKPVHVVEQVEGVRHPDEPQEAERDRDPVAVDELHGQAARERDAGSADLEPKLRPGRKCPEIVDEAGQEEQRAPADDAPKLAARLEGARGHGYADPGDDAREDPQPADERRLALVPAIVPRRGREPVGERATKSRPDHRKGGRQSGDRGKRGHGHRSVTKGC